MPKIDFTKALKIKGAGGEFSRVKGQGFAWAAAGEPEPEFSPASLFLPGDIGWAYDTSVRETLFQDRFWSVPVTDFEQPVGSQLSILPSGLPRSAPNDAARAVYRQDGNGFPILAFDGVDDGMSTPIHAWNTPDATIVVGFGRNSASGLNLYERGTGQDNTFRVFQRNLSGRQTFQTVVRGASNRGSDLPGTYAAPGSFTITFCAKLVGSPPNVSRIDGVDLSVSSALPNGTVFDETSMFFYTRNHANSYCSGRDYCSFGINRILTNEELLAVEAWTNSRRGSV